MKITLKDGSIKEYAEAMSAYDIARDISEGLARKATHPPFWTATRACSS